MAGLCRYYIPKDKPSPEVRFRDLSDLRKSPGHGTADTRQYKSKLGTTGEGTAEVPLILEPKEINEATHSFDETDHSLTCLATNPLRAPYSRGLVQKLKRRLPLAKSPRIKRNYW
jgi:hypothetical protein